jgi:opacity protein-like surface antigen
MTYALKNRKYVAASLAVLLGAGFSVAHAQQSPFYVTAAVGKAEYDFDFASQVQALGVTGQLGIRDVSIRKDSDTGFKVGLGYQFLPWLGVEADFVNLGKPATAYTQFGVGTFTRQGEYKIDGFNLSVVGTHAFNDQWSAYGKVGMFRSKLEYSESGTNQSAFNPPPPSFTPTHSLSLSDEKSTELSYGLGVDFKFNNNLSMRLGWDRFTKIGSRIAKDPDPVAFPNKGGQFDNIDLYSIGLVARF